MKQNTNKTLLAIILVMTSLIGCNKDLEVTDSNNPTVESYFKTAAELQKGVNGIYSILRDGSLVAREWFFLHDLRGGEFAAGGAQLDAGRTELLNAPKPDAGNPVMSDEWGGNYTMINRANVVLSKAPDITDDIALRDRLVGETQFLRAWAYYELVSQWGDVPVYTEPITSTVGFKPRSPSADIYALIISDLTAAVAALPASYGASDLGRATSGAALALLARVQMQQGDYASAKAALLQIYGKYSLTAEYNWNFDGEVYNDAGAQMTAGHEFNSESVFEVVFVEKPGKGLDFNWGYNGEGSTSPLATVRPQEYGITWGNMIPSNQFLDEFEAGDPRYAYTIYEEGNQILTGMPNPNTPLTLTNSMINMAASTSHGVTIKRFFRKYNCYEWANSSSKSGGINQRVIRYADVLLMLAECEAELGNIAQAASYINEVRARPSVNMPPVNPATHDAAMLAVMHERRVELGGEEIASIDILRWRAKGYYPSIAPDPKPSQVSMLPIPTQETSTNPLVTN